MHRKNPISVLVYNSLFPTPSPTDPPSFSAHLSKSLVGEVRIETANFYGSLDTIEARYPGLNYASAPHRKRLGRFPNHRRLFEAFDRLDLTAAEIKGFCRWEGTLWARERYERDEGVRVEDTTGMEIKEWVNRRGQCVRGSNGAKGINVKTDIEVEIEQVSMTTATASASTTSTIPTDRGTFARPHHHHHHHHHHHNHHPSLDIEMPDSSSDEEEEEESDTEPSLSTSIGFSLNARLLHAAALREQGANVSMDPEWEQYLKEAQERGELNIDATHEALRSMAGQIAQLHHQATQHVVDAETPLSASSSSSSSSSSTPQAFEPPAAPA